jgi:hypothetical protein
MKLRKIISFSLAATLALPLSSISSHLIPNARADMNSASNADPDADYDRLDGTGKSGKKVDVIEWEGNLEVHIYPKGSTAGLGMKIDGSTGQKVMVIAYRFVETPRQVLTRRAILGITLADNFKVYKDPMENEFDKFIVSNNGLSGQVALYKMDPTPTQLYPDGPAVAKRAQNTGRTPASAQAQPPIQQGASAPSNSGGGSQNGPGPAQMDDNGTISPFMMNNAQGRGR